jgi:hypothetical protein
LQGAQNNFRTNLLGTFPEYLAVETSIANAADTWCHWITSESPTNRELMAISPFMRTYLRRPNLALRGSMT